MRLGWQRVLRGAFALGLVALIVLQLNHSSELLAEDFRHGTRRALTAQDEVDPLDAIPGLWGWDQRCLPDINRTWVGGNVSSPHDPPGLELPISFWSAIPSVRDDGITIVIIGPQYSTKRHRSAPGMSPRSNFSKYEFECHFPSVNQTVPGIIEHDPHKNLGIVKCLVPQNEPLALGIRTSTTFEFRDLSHHGSLQFTSCVRPISKRKYELTAVVAARNIACHLEEWLENLFIHGFDHVYFYDHFNEDAHTHALLSRYIMQGLVTVMPWRMSRDILWGGVWDRAQIMLYNDALHRFRHDWLFVGDVDELPFFAPLTQPPGIANVTFFNQTKYLDKSIPRPDFKLPPIPEFSVNHTRKMMRKPFLSYLEALDAQSNHTLGAVEMRHLLFGTAFGTNNKTQPFCLPNGQLKLRAQVMRGGILPSSHRLSQIARKYIAKTDRVKIVSIHMIAKGGPIVVAPMNTLRLHHYWRGERSSKLEHNMWVDVSGVRWADVIEKRIAQRRNGTLTGLLD